MKNRCERLLYKSVITGREHPENLIVLNNVKGFVIRRFSFIHFLVFESNTKIY